MRLPIPLGLAVGYLQPINQQATLITPKTAKNSGISAKSLDCNWLSAFLRLVVLARLAGRLDSADLTVRKHELKNESKVTTRVLELRCSDVLI